MLCHHHDHHRHHIFFLTRVAIIVQVVISVSENSQAYQAGLRVNDKILKINGADMKWMTEASWKRQFTTNRTDITLKIQRMTTHRDRHMNDSTVCVLLDF